MKQEDTIKMLDQEIRRLKDELGQLQRARKAYERKEYEVAAF
jgi:hypothetical protein